MAEHFSHTLFEETAEQLPKNIGKLLSSQSPMGQKNLAVLLGQGQIS